MTTEFQNTVTGKYDNIELNDNFNAKFFASYYSDKVLWCKDLGGWYIFNGNFWEKDINDLIGVYAVNIIDILKKEFEENGYKKNRHKNWIRRFGNTHAWKSMLESAKLYLGKSADKFDKDPILFNCLNGIVNLSNKNCFSNPDPKHLITKTGHVHYKLLSECPRWNKFLHEIFVGDLEIIEFMQRVCGYCMTAMTNEQCMFILYGSGGNGKSKFIETIAHILGDYAKNCPSSTFIQKQNPGIPNDIARLKGARLVMANETNQNVTIDEELIKQLTSSNTITARFLNREFFDFEPTFKIFLSTNHKPNIRGTDQGIWRKIHMIPFLLNIPEADMDRDLGNKLITQSSGILNWMIEGYFKYKNMGLCVPKKIYEATQLYREEEDDLGQFIKDECVIEKGSFIATQDFKARFKAVNGYYKGQKALVEYMERHGFKPNNDNRQYINGKQQRVYVNLKWANGHIPQDSQEIDWQDSPTVYEPTANGSGVQSPAR